MLGRSLLLKVRRPQPVYPDYVQEYFNRVIAADVAAGNTSGLEYEITDAISTCLQALVADGILGVSGGVLSQAASLIKASCFMMGARTLSGALVPLAADMPAPTNFNFTGLRYNRRTGLQGNNSTTHLNTNRNNNADSQNNVHMAVWASSLPSNNGTPIMGMTRLNTQGTGASLIYNHITRLRDAASTAFTPVSGFIGLSRNNPASYTRRNNSISQVITQASATPVSGDILLYHDTPLNAPVYSDVRLSFYSIGSALDLAILDARITALSNAIQAAIAP